MLMRIGAYAEYIAVSVDMLMKKPGNMKWEEAAGIPEVFLLPVFSPPANQSDLDNSNPSPAPHR